MAVTRAPEGAEADPRVEPDPGDALFEEARQRRRARRRRIAGLAVGLSLVAAAGIVGAVAMNGDGGASGERTALEAGAGAVAVPEPLPGDPTTLVASWGGFHEGWVLVYADGRVIWYPDAGAGLEGGVDRYTTVERNLTPVGLDQVESGAIDAAELNRPGTIQDDLWADAGFHPYAPARFAACGWRQYERWGEWVDASIVFGDLPPAARATVRGTQQTITGMGLLGNHPPEMTRPVECFILPAEQADDLVALSERPVTGYPSDGGQLTFVDFDRALVTELWIQPVMPHGQFMLWGG